ncbi:MAG TPA: hypothetical protein ENH82_00435 [bacterium]|nr:hypothetical protein [bacterium]
MTFIPIIDPAAPNCPLCDKKMLRTVWEGVDFYYCRLDVVAIRKDDPNIDQWKNYVPEDSNAIICSVEKCRAKMNFFFRSDGFMKAVCSNPRCRAAVETGILPYAKPIKKIGRNAPCRCGSGKKYKRCCLDKELGK